MSSEERISGHVYLVSFFVGLFVRTKELVVVPRKLVEFSSLSYYNVIVLDI